MVQKIPSLLWEILQIAAAVILSSIGLKAFLLPNGFLDGGVTGIAILLSNFLAIEISYILPLVTIPFFIMGWYTVSKRILDQVDHLPGGPGPDHPLSRTSVR